MTVQLTADQEAMVRIMASGIGGSGQDDFVDAVKARLEGEGKPINTQIVRAAATRELMRNSEEITPPSGGGGGGGDNVLTLNGVTLQLNGQDLTLGA